MRWRAGLTPAHQVPDSAHTGVASLKAAQVAIIGGGPAGLMAAEVLANGGAQVDLYDAMPSIGRKFLLAGKGGLNLTHAEPAAQFTQRYGAGEPQLLASVGQFGADQVREWAQGLGIATFVGTSSRVFPIEKKAAPLLRAWQKRLREAGVCFHMRHRWTGWNSARSMGFATPAGAIELSPAVVILALGGGSWARLGSDGAWVPWLRDQNVTVAPLKPSNCGFDIAWSEHFRSRFAGHPLKSVRLMFDEDAALPFRRDGECMITDSGIEGGLIYAASARLREHIAATGFARVTLDLLPQHQPDRVLRELRHPRGARSQASHLKSRLGFYGVKAGLLREVLPREGFAEPLRLAAAIKALPLTLIAPRPLDEAISSAGGVCFAALDEHLMLERLPGVFCAGEMLDWEAPTGGYLLTACLATGRAAGLGALAWLARASADGSDPQVCDPAAVGRQDGARLLLDEAAP